MWAHKKYWRHVKTLVLDEVSMVDAEFLDWCEAHVRAMVGSDQQVFGQGNANKPFGGMQLILTGDFNAQPTGDYDDVGHIAGPRLAPLTQQKRTRARNFYSDSCDDRNSASHNHG